MSKGFLHAYVFLAGAAVLALELSASRLLAPYFGSSLFVWGNIIGIVLGALAFGYYYGGRLADRSPGPRSLGAVTWSAGMAVSVIPLVSPFVLRNVTDVLHGLPLFLIGASFVSMLLLFAVPLVLLGALTPIANRIGIREIGEVGSVSGSLSASSTAGSLFGVFLPSFVTIPLLGTRFTILASGILLIGLGAAASRRKGFLVGLILPVALLAFGGASALASGGNVVFAAESAYQPIRVIKKDGRHYLITNEGAGIQTVEMDERGLTGTYTDAFAAGTYLHDGGRPLDMLHIGVAGGSGIRQMRHFLGEQGIGRMDAVEIDPLMFEVAERYFGLTAEAANRIAEDGRTFLRGTERTYDVIVVDAYQDELYIPFHLATAEFYELVRSRLAPDGLVLLNAIDSDLDGPLLGHLGETLRSAFPFVETSQVLDHNFLIVGSEKPLRWERLEEVPEALRPIARRMLEGRRPIDAAERVLTDDRAPLEYLTDRFILKTITEASL